MYSIEEKGDEINFSISAENKHVDRIIHEAERFCQDLGLEQNQPLKIVARELLINAIEHGCLSNSDFIVNVSFKTVGREMICVTVSDPGAGFDYHSIESQIPDDPTQLRKRGYPLIYANAEEIDFNENGNEIKALISLGTETSFQVSRSEQWYVITPNGDITASITAKFRDLLLKLIDEGAGYFRFDFRNVTDIDSIGLSVMVSFATMTGGIEKSGTRIITNCSCDCNHLFLLTHMDKLYQLEIKAKEVSNAI